MKRPEEVKPFLGWRFDVQAAQAAIENLLCPPYDVISPDEQEIYEGRSPHNAVHLILPPASVRRTAQGGRHDYAQQARLFQALREKRILRRDAEPSFYYVHQTFRHPERGVRLVRKGVIGLRRLSEVAEGKVLPHEHTLSGPKSDRMRILQAVKANLSPLFFLYEEREASLDAQLEAQVKGAPPLFTCDLPDETQLSLWRIHSPGAVSLIQERLSCPVFIADGHHRYETALRYARAHQGPAEEKEAAQYVLAFFVSFADPGLLLLPTHRLMKGVSGFDAGRFVRSLRHRFAVQPLASLPPTPAAIAEVLAAKGMRFVISFPCPIEGSRHHMVVVGDADISKDLVEGLDVSVLHREILAKELGIDAGAVDTQRTISYTRDPQEAESLAANAQIQAAFFMRPPSVSQMRQVCESKRLMPQKSTYFYPKIPTGLVFYPHQGS